MGGPRIFENLGILWACMVWEVVGVAGGRINENPPIVGAVGGGGGRVFPESERM